MDAVKEQPAPVRTGGPAVWDLVMDDMAQRDRVGSERYGTRLQPHNDRDALVDAYQEALDLSVYLRQRIEEEKKPRITAVYLDVDGVLADFVGGACAAHEFDRLRLAPGKWDISECMGITLQEFWSKCRGHDFWRRLHLMPDAEVVIGAVNTLDCAQWLLTQPSDDPGSYSGKYSWLCCHLPAWKSVSIFARDKTGVAGPGRLLVDDNEVNVQAWQLAGGEAILLPRPWNRMHAAAHYAVEYLEERIAEYRPRCGRP